MVRVLTAFMMWCSASYSLAETLTVNRPVRAAEVLTAKDLKIMPRSIDGTYVAVSAAIGLEARVNLYPGRPIRLSDLGPAALIGRNQIVRMIYRRAGLVILADGRALDRAGAGEEIRIMNLSSRATVHAIVLANGEVEVLR